MEFYVRLLKEPAAAGGLDPRAPTMVVAADRFDRDALVAAGVADAAISNFGASVT